MNQTIQDISQIQFPEGTKFTDYIEDRTNGQFKELKGGYLEINLFLRGGKIIPYQNSSNISSTIDLRYKKTTLIINPDQNIKASGHIIFDNDEIDPILNKTYLHIRVDLDKNFLTFSTLNLGIKNNNNIDDIIESIIFYRASEIKKNIVKFANIQTYSNKKFKIKADYIKEEDILLLKNINIPIYIIKYISLA